MEEGLVNPHWLDNTRITPSFPQNRIWKKKHAFSSTPNTNCLPKVVKGKWLLPSLPKFKNHPGVTLLRNHTFMYKGEPDQYFFEHLLFKMFNLPYSNNVFR